MLVLNFNTKAHTLKFTNNGTTMSFDDITTIKKEGDVYEVYQRQKDGMTAPFGKFPVVNTVVLYSHEF